MPRDVAKEALSGLCGWGDIMDCGPVWAFLSKASLSGCSIRWRFSHISGPIHFAALDRLNGIDLAGFVEF